MLTAIPSLYSVWHFSTYLLILVIPFCFLLAYTDDTIAVGVARVGSANQQIVCSSMKELLSHDLGPPLHSLIIPGHLHFIEKDMLRIFALNPAILDESWHPRRLKIVSIGMHKCTFKEAMKCFVECNKKKSILIVHIVPNSILFSCYISNTFQADKTYHSTFFLGLRLCHTNLTPPIA